jgi:RHS repeat-associated protein
VNPLNQITSRTVVGSRYLDLIGLAESGTTVTAGGVIASRRGEFWRAELNLGNGNPLWQSVNITTSDGGSLANAPYRVPPSSEVPTYDADGNLTADGLWTYTWDAENRLISMQSQALVPAAGRRKLDFEYDPLGRRIGRIVSTGASGSWVPTSTTRWLYEGWNPVAELNGAGTLVREYVWGTDLSGSWQGAGGVGGLLWVLEAPTGPSINAHYVAYDGNGNVMGLVNAADGTWSARYEYGPFGEVIRSTGSMAATNPFRWSTKIQDEDSGLNYYGYRYYSAGVGRWLSTDPIGELGGLNLYGFVYNNTLSRIDPFGLQSPMAIQLEILAEIRAGISWAQIAADYGVKLEYVVGVAAVWMAAEAAKPWVDKITIARSWDRVDCPDPCKNNKDFNAVADEFKNIVNDIWRPLHNATQVIGDGGAIDAAIHEAQNPGKKVGGQLHGQKISDKANELKKLLNRVNQRNKNFPSICQDRLRPMLEELKKKIDNAISTINALKNTPPPAQ